MLSIGPLGPARSPRQLSALGKEPTLLQELSYLTFMYLGERI